MTTSPDAFGFALQRIWLAAPDPFTALSEQTADQLVDYLMVTEPSATLPSFYEHQILERLGIAASSPSLGDYLATRLVDTRLDWQTEQTGLSTDTLEAICQDNLMPTSIPLMRMKRLIGFLALSVEDTLLAIEETAYRFQKQLRANPALAQVAYSRIAPPSSESASLASSNGDRLFEQDEAIQVYLDRLSALLSADVHSQD
ncbi:hypothetical protein ACAW74_05885 [Fibrella sp. WM1]|uniref:hypothetical protein n=1 Tax=Fibrella musci TaxID=3242485 RepID=UPI003522DECC